MLPKPAAAPHKKLCRDKKRIRRVVDACPATITGQTSCGSNPAGNQRLASAAEWWG